VVDAMLCGLSGAGMLDHDFDNPPPTIDTDAVDIAGDEEKWSSRPFALRETDQVRSQTQKGWKQVHRFALAKDDDGNVSRWLVVYERIGQVENEDGRALSTREQTLTDHQSDVVRRVRKTAEKIGLPPEHVSALAIAARLHDEGKRLWRWQRAFNAPRNGVYAKTRGPLNTRLLDGYRHEFASLWKVEEDAEFMRLDSEIQDLVLHLVAAHHGYARPVISTRNCEEDGSEQKAREVALRFARLQKCWSSWGLAWWESLLRAADQGASRANDEQGIEADETASVPGTTEEAA
jgi:CRISPR-associated endonuclease/helicase Cas3